MYQVSGVDFADLASAVEAAKKYERCQITQHYKDGQCGYAGQRSVVASFVGGCDLRQFAADEDGQPDLFVRSQSLTLSGH